MVAGRSSRCGLHFGTGNAVGALNGTHLPGRVSLQIVGFALLVLYVVPTIVLETTNGSWDTLQGRSIGWWVGLTPLMLLGVVLALAAVVEFVVVGKGSPVPLDPPLNLVVTGPYAYIANPMQMGASWLMSMVGVANGSWPILLSGFGALAFSAGYAQMYESEELDGRFGSAWSRYRANVAMFRFRWRPYVEQSATVWVAAMCEQCQETGRFLDRLDPLLVVRKPAERARPKVDRLTFEAQNGFRSAGLAGIARVFERVNLAWAMLGWLLRMPVIGRFFQLVADVSGAGPQTIPDEVLPDHQCLDDKLAES